MAKKKNKEAPEVPIETIEEVVNSEMSDTPETGNAFVIDMINGEYAPYYPTNKIWHVTTDNSVFLEGDLSSAKYHQESLNLTKNKGEVLTIKLD